MPNCKIGDRAMIIHRDNYGKQCIIIKSYDALFWFVEMLEPATVFFNNTGFKKPAGNKGIIDKIYVVPLTDPDQDIVETNKELEIA